MANKLAWKFTNDCEKREWLMLMGARYTNLFSVFVTIPIGCGWRVVGRETVSLERVIGRTRFWYIFFLFILRVTFFAPMWNRVNSINKWGTNPHFPPYIPTGFIMFYMLYDSGRGIRAGISFQMSFPQSYLCMKIIVWEKYEPCFTCIWHIELQ